MQGIDLAAEFGTADPYDTQVLPEHRRLRARLERLDERRLRLRELSGVRQRRGEAARRLLVARLGLESRSVGRARLLDVLPLRPHVPDGRPETRGRRPEARGFRQL